MIELEGYEADDLIGTIAKKVSKEIDVYMVTPDKDFAQLVEDNIFIYKPPYMGKGFEILGVEKVKEKWEVEDPIQVIDILGLWGDAVDNIPGVPGVGEKTAKKFVKAYGSIEGLYENTHELKGKIKEKVENNKEQAFISKQLATIILDAPIEFDKKAYRTSNYNRKKLEELFVELEFKTLGTRVLGSSYSYAQAAENKQKTLFDIEGEEVEQIELGKNIESVKVNYFAVNSKKDLKDLISKLNSTDKISFDTETTGINPITCELVGFSFSVKAEEAYYIPFINGNLSQEEILASIKPILESPSKLKIGQNIKYDIIVLKKYNINVSTPYFDTMLAHYVLKPDGRHNMNVLAEEYLGYTPISIETLIGKKGKNQKSMKDVPLDSITPYACEDADITYQLYEKFSEMLIGKSYENVFKSVELPTYRRFSRYGNDRSCA